MPSGRHIRLLPGEVANKIAAGEVVDRPPPSSRSLSRTPSTPARPRSTSTWSRRPQADCRADNGSGMDRDDALLSVERHATSKIRDVDDIERINHPRLPRRGPGGDRLGLPLRLATATAESRRGASFSSTAEVPGRARDRPSAGTTVEVRDLVLSTCRPPASSCGRWIRSSHIADTSHGDVLVWYSSTGLSTVGDTRWRGANCAHF